MVYFRVDSLLVYLLHIGFLDDTGKKRLFPLRVRPFPKADGLRLAAHTLPFTRSTQGHDKQGVWRDIHSNDAVKVWVENALDWGTRFRIPNHHHTVLSSICRDDPFLVLADGDGCDRIAMPLL